MATLFERITRSISVGEIADKMAVIDATWNCEGAFIELMESGCHYGVVVQDGQPVGYLTVDDDTLTQENSEDDVLSHVVRFDPNRIVAASRPVLEALPLLARHYHLFTVEDQIIKGVLTRNSVETLEFRYCLFGVVMEIEHWLGRLIRRSILEPIEKATLSPAWGERVSAAEALFFSKLHWRRVIAVKEEMESSFTPFIPPIDCMSFKDKLYYCLRDPRTRHQLGQSTTHRLTALLDTLVELRNNLAHGKSLLTVNRISGQTAELAMELNDLAGTLADSCGEEDA